MPSSVCESTRVWAGQIRVITGHGVKFALSARQICDELGNPVPSSTMQPVIENARRRQAHSCAWCGKQLDEPAKPGRRRNYCSHSCRQRAYERRAAVQRGGLPEDAVVFSTEEMAEMQDRLFQVRCAAEDIATAVNDGVDQAELHQLAAELIANVQGLEKLR